MSLKSGLVSLFLIATFLLNASCSKSESSTPSQSPDKAADEFSSAIDQMESRKPVTPAELANQKYEILGFQEVLTRHSEPREYLTNGLIEISFGAEEQTPSPSDPQKTYLMIQITAKTACQTVKLYSTYTQNIPTALASHTVNFQKEVALNPACKSAADINLAKLISRLQTNFNFVSMLNRLVYVASVDSLTSESGGILFILRPK